MIVVKRRLHRQKFDERKVYATVFRACLSCHLEETKAEAISEAVTKEIKRWVKGRKQITSREIFTHVIKILKILDKDVALMYESHRDVG